LVKLHRYVKSNGKGFSIQTKMKQGLLLFIVLLFSMGLEAQYDYTSFYTSPKTDSLQTQKLFLSLENQNLLRNNEFFNNIDPGFTVFGSLLNTTLKYSPVQNFLLEGGIHFLKHYGENRFDRVVPLFRVQYAILPELQVIMGNIYGGLNHNYIEPFYRFDRFMEDPPETGLQFLLNTTRIHSDLYINWEHFLHRDGYNDEEQFTLGWTNNFSITSPESQLKLSIPVQLLAHHIGGQIDTLNLPDGSLVNYAVGISLGYRLPGMVTEIGVQLHGIGYRELASPAQMPFDKGHAIYPLFYTRLKWADLYLGYWKAYHFIAPRGEPLFSSISNIQPSLVFPERKLFVFKLNIHHQIATGISIGARYEGYYDLKGTLPGITQSHYDFSYGMYINFKRDLILKKMGKQP